MSWPARPGGPPPLSDGVRAAMERAAAAGGNPASVHQLGQRARVALEHAEAQLYALLGRDHGSCTWWADATEASFEAIDHALAARGWATGGRVRMVGGGWRRWAPLVRALQALRGGTAHLRASEGEQDLLWCGRGGTRAAVAGEEDVLVWDVWDPRTGRPVAPHPSGASRPHCHAVIGAYGLAYHGEPWPPPARTADSVAVDGRAFGGPAGLACALTPGQHGTLHGGGTVPRELIAGLGAAARERSASGGAQHGALAERRGRREASWARAMGLPPERAEEADGGDLRAAGRLWLPVPPCGVAKAAELAAREGDLVPWHEDDGQCVGYLGWL